MAIGTVAGVSVRPGEPYATPGDAVNAISSAREDAIVSMLQRAENLGADAVVGVRFGSGGSPEHVMAYGTTVTLKKCWRF